MVPLLLALALHAAAPSPTVTLEHTPVGVCTVGQPLLVGAQIKAVAGKRVFEPALFVRPAGAKAFQRLKMLPGGAVDSFVARLAPELTSQDLDYFLEAFDDAGHGPFRLGNPEAPFRLAVVVAPPPAPALEPTAPTPAATTPTPATPAPTPATTATTPATDARAAEPTPITIEVPVASAPAPRRELWRATTVGGVATLGGGAALLIAGGAVGALAAKDFEDQKTAVANNDVPAWERAKEATRTKSIAADVLLVTGGVAALVGAGLTLYGVLTADPAHPQAPAVSVAVGLGAGSVGATLSGRF